MRLARESEPPPCTQRMLALASEHPLRTARDESVQQQLERRAACSGGNEAVDLAGSAAGRGVAALAGV